MKLNGLELLERRLTDGVETGVDAAVVDGVRLGVAKDSFVRERVMACCSCSVMSSSICSTRTAWPPRRLVM